MKKLFCSSVRAITFQKIKPRCTNNGSKDEFVSQSCPTSPNFALGAYHLAFGPFCLSTSDVLASPIGLAAKVANLIPHL